MGKKGNARRRQANRDKARAHKSKPRHGAPAKQPPPHQQHMLLYAAATLAEGGDLSQPDFFDGLDDPAYADPPWRDDEEPALSVQELIELARTGQGKDPRTRANEAAERVKARRQLEASLPPAIGDTNVSAKTGTLEKFSVTIMPDTKLKYEDLYLEVYFEGDRYEEGGFAEWLVRSGCSRASCPQDADLVIFGGGVDVDPGLYGMAEDVHKETKWDENRDNSDIMTYLECYNSGIPMLGICRGAQFLHVMNGGKLYQHVDNHYGDHDMIDLNTREVIHRVSSVHHQMVMQNIAGGMQILATTQKARNRFTGKEENHKGTAADIEAFFYRDTMCLGVQGHPEYRGYYQFQQWVSKQIQDLIICNPDIGWSDNNKRRLKPDILAMRESGGLVATEINTSEGVVN